MRRKGGRVLIPTMAVALLGLVVLGIPSSEVLADGTETLGPPSISIAAGSGVVAAGTGLAVQPGDISFNVPAGAAVVQVLLYWEGQDFQVFWGDDTIMVNGIEVIGTQIGGPIFWLDDGVSTTYRADITGLGLVGPGANTLTVEGLNFTNFANGAGVLVIIDDGSSQSNIEIRDGNDLAFQFWPAPMDTTVAQTFTFPASSEQRTGTIWMLFSAVSGTNSSGGVFRPTAIDITVGGVTVTYDNLLDSLDGQEWDTVALDVTIPANETMLTVQALSVDNLGIGGLPASLTWNAAALSVPQDEQDGEGCTPGFWKNPKKFDLWPIDPATLFSDVFGVGPADPMADTIALGGGGERALIRHGTAAYLNALSPAVDYFYSPDEVIAIVQDAYATGEFTAAKDMLEAQNDPTFCPLSS